MQSSLKTTLLSYSRKNNQTIGIVAGVALAIIVIISQLKPKVDMNQKTYLGQANKPRGVRNNNPGNIRYNPTIAWKGKIPISQNTDRSFEQFVEWRYGVRALIKILSKYIVRYGTIEKMLRVYAPIIENNTAAYIQAVSNETGYPANQALTTTKETLRRLTIAVAKHEVGSGYVTDEDFNNAYLIL